MTFSEQLPVVGQHIQIKWGEGAWIDYGTLRTIKDVGQVPGETWLLSSQGIYQNSVVRHYDQWEIKA
jgi:hypothetical protein